MLLITEIDAGSDAEQAGLKPGDKIISINEDKIIDQLDFEFCQGEEFLDFVILRKKELISISIQRSYGHSLGITPQEMSIKKCRNNCVFCFVHQMPKGMRKSLYIKDEDYRYSFLHGNFITLSNMKPADWERIRELSLSPLYISVHATDPELRARMLNNHKLEPILDRLTWLKANSIQLHTQLVIVPGYNDKEKLEQSLNDLLDLHPSVQSIAVVPVGITQYRQDLQAIQSFTPEIALDCLQRMEPIQTACKERFGRNFIYASDEVYILAGKPLPGTEHYGDYPQYENGVGITTSFLHDFYQALPNLPKVNPGKKISILSSTLPFPFIQEIAKRLKEKTGLQSEILECDNTTYGTSVTVAGLLCGKDIEAGLKRSTLKGPAFVPPFSVNEEGLFMDDISLQDLSKKYNRPVIAPGSFQDFFI
ncbi:MAG: DUF512 domain-containing protein [Fibrobacteria bacterium]|nr:DUF512 domain-containing protein [Fibrobacteria bacterium]